MTAETMNDAVDQVVDQLPRKKMSGKKLVLLVVLPLLVLGGGAGALYATGVIDKLLGGGAEEDGAVAEASAPAEPVGPGVFYDLPDMLVNLNTTANRQHFLKISVSLEVGSEEDVAAIEEVMPRIIDNFQVYLRELTLDDLRGSAGLYRLREELLRRVDTAAGDATVRDVLFREMLVQ